MPVLDTPGYINVPAARDMIDRYLAARRDGFIHTEEVLGRYLMNVGDILVREIASSFGSFDSLLRAAEHGYRPTLRAEFGERYVLLADLYDLVAGLRGLGVVAYRG
jgi:hypothetical protein